MASAAKSEAMNGTSDGGLSTRRAFPAALSLSASRPIQAFLARSRRGTERLPETGTESETEIETETETETGRGTETETETETGREVARTRREIEMMSLTARKTLNSRRCAR
jgi:hypothetical protein